LSVNSSVRGDNQDERAASIRMRIAGGGLTEGGRSPGDERRELSPESRAQTQARPGD
jgi:hypothetical protein